MLLAHSAFVVYRFSQPNCRRVVPLFSILDNTQGLPVALSSQWERILSECMPFKGMLVMHDGN
jgi:hypothetical protein